ncbi:MAG TPA: ABC transporter ATP-binding protein [Candidatus Nitrosotenuis sp.]|nr:ABC transporter ATP-binding protein [Candidatus Nitrosotenuis sp.]
MSTPKISLTPRELWQSVRRLAPYARPHWKSFATGLLATFLLNGIAVLQPQVLRILTDRVLMKDGDLQILHLCMLALLASAVVKGAFLFVQRYMMPHAIQSTIKGMREDVYRHLQMLPLAWFDKARMGDVIFRLTENIRVVTELLGSGLVRLLNDLMVGLGALVLMIWQSPLLTVLAFLLSPLTAWLISSFEKKMARIVGGAGQMLDPSSLIHETLSGIRVVKAFGMEEREARRFRDTSSEIYRLAVKASQPVLLQSPVVEVLSTLSLVMVIGAGAWLVIHRQMTLGEFLTFWAYLLLASTPLSRATHNFVNLRRGLLAAYNIFELKDVAPEVHDHPQAVPLPPIHDRIEFEGVTFSYTPGLPVLKNISFTVPCGRTVAVVGPNGAGKTTLVSLLARFYDPQEGVIRIDGHPLTQVKLESLRRQMAFVLQETVLFSGSVRDNIAYGRPGATFEQVVEVARAARCHDFVSALPSGYDTLLDEGGRGLSGGQRQRLAIARALLADPRILVLDEATASLDYESEREIQAATEELMRGRTTFIIAHRLSTVHRADIILVLDQGELVDMGTHAELLARCPVYLRLYQAFHSVSEAS